MRIATFNIDKDSGSFPERIFDLSDELGRHRIDILCLQEDFCAQHFHTSKFLNLELDYHMVSSQTRTKVRNNIKSSSNLTILSKYPVLLLEEIYIHQGKKDERCCQICEVNRKGKRILVLNTHLCHLSSRNRMEHLQIIFDKLRKYKYEYIFFCGDFNALPLYEEIKYIQNQGFELIDSDFTHEDKVVLDYIFYKSKKRQLKVKSNIVLKEFSDHFCLMHVIKGMV